MAGHLRRKGDPITDLATWRAEIERVLGPFMAGFEDTIGYPPGDNYIGDADLDAAARADLRSLPSPLADFYRVIGEVVLPDIGNGHFIHAAGHVLDELGELGTVRAADGVAGIVFASDGGGILFAIASTGTIHRSHAASRDSGFELVATNLADYLDQLKNAVTECIRTGAPGDL